MNEIAARTADPIALAESRMRWLDCRQAVLAGNIANADTPGFRPRDLHPFVAMLRRGAAAGAVVRTHAAHLASATLPGSAARRGAESAPDGNAVSLDEQALKIAETDSAHAFATALHRRWTGMIRTALGRGG
ncbi:flagellar basal body protein [Roseomonas sp. CCTCC AB2023176]|uniref:flagellar basal body protein n=1 Tax=Roseomonas sp. CCTCC AB2023176 TaxID=3342640 RepID=UPI0035E37E5A